MISFFKRQIACHTFSVAILLTHYICVQMFLYLFVDMGHVLRCRDLPNLVCAKTFPLLFCSMVTKNLPNERILLYVSKKLFLTSTEFECGIGLYRPLQTNSFIQINYPAKVCTVSLNPMFSISSFMPYWESYHFTRSSLSMSK